MSIRVCQNSFSKGIISPSLQGRIDLAQYSNALKKLNNGIVLQEGCILNRPGLEFLVEAKYPERKTRLIPFVFGLDQNYVIEMGHTYMRFIMNGGYILDDNDEVYEILTPYYEEDLFEIDYVQQADVITFVHKKYMPAQLARISHNEWEFEYIDFKSSISAPKNLKAVYTGSTASNTKDYLYVVCAVDKTTNEESSRSYIATVKGHRESSWTTSEYITLTWDAVTNAAEYNIYRSVNGIYAYVGTSASTSFVDDNIEPDLSSCAPVTVDPFLHQHPSCVCYFQQRKIYACSNINPQTLWASQTGTNDNFNVSRPLNATDAVTMSLYDNVANQIQFLLPFDDLLIMSSNAEWAVNGSDGVFCASPSPVANIQSYYGSSKIKPVVSGSMVLFVQSGGNIVRDLGYSYLSDSYDGEELSLFANHLFEGKQIVDMAYSKEPYRILWCVMNDGTINALTYNPKQKVSAWHTHSTLGEFESVTTIRENYEDIAYFVIKRKINNKTVRYIERFKTRTLNDMEGAFFLDSALSKTFDEEVDEISGLEHLKNTDVYALLDYGVVDNLKVDSSGHVNLPYAAKNVIIGLPYTFEFESLNLESTGTFGLNKVINEISIKILNSREDFFIKNDDGTLSQNQRSYASVNDSKMVFSKDVTFCPLTDASKEASVKIIQKYPLPLNILSFCANLSVEEVESQ